MRATPVDPRDQTVEIDAPRYRVLFWTGPSHSDEWELTEADLDEVLAWIDENARGRTHSLWVVLDRGSDVEHIRLRGIDPAASPECWPPWAVETR